MRDVGYVEDSTDILTGYAHFNGKRTVYIPVTKRADSDARNTAAPMMSST